MPVAFPAPKPKTLEETDPLKFAVEEGIKEAIPKVKQIVKEHAIENAREIKNEVKI